MRDREIDFTEILLPAGRNHTYPMNQTMRKQYHQFFLIGGFWQLNVLAWQ